MTIALSAHHFDTLEFVKKSKELGENEQLAEYYAKQIENVLDIAVLAAQEEYQSKELATKTDLKIVELALQKEIKTVELALQKEIKNSEIKLMTLMGAQFVAILGILAKIFHWL